MHLLDASCRAIYGIFKDGPINFVVSRDWIMVYSDGSPAEILRKAKYIDSGQSDQSIYIVRSTGKKQLESSRWLGGVLYRALVKTTGKQPVAWRDIVRGTCKKQMKSSWWLGSVLCGALVKKKPLQRKHGLEYQPQRYNLNNFENGVKHHMNHL